MMKRIAIGMLAVLLVLTGCGTKPAKPGDTVLDPRPSVPEVSQGGQTPTPTPQPNPQPNPQPTPEPVPTPQPTPTPEAKCPTKDVYTPSEAEACIKDRAAVVIKALKAHDMKALAALVHPKEGVRFGLEGRIQESPAFLPSQVETLWNNQTQYLWGYVGGKPTEVKSTFQDLYKNYLYKEDYANAPVVAYGRIYRSGNGNVSIPAGQILVEYHFEGFDPKYGGIDWTSLRLYFKQSGGQWYLVSVIKDNWQI